MSDTEEAAALNAYYKERGARAVRRGVGAIHALAVAYESRPAAAERSTIGSRMAGALFHINQEQVRVVLDHLTSNGYLVKRGDGRYDITQQGIDLYRAITGADW